MMTRNIPSTHMAPQSADSLVPSSKAPSPIATYPPPNLPPPFASHSVDHENSDNEWDQSDPDWDEDSEDAALKPTATNVPSALQVGRGNPGSSKPTSGTHLPPSLMAGTSLGAVMRKSQENMNQHAAVPNQSMNSLVSAVSSLSTSSQEPPKMQSYNPFLRPQRTGDQIFGTDRAWANEPSNYVRPDSQTAPVELPAVQTLPETGSTIPFGQNHTKQPLSPNSRQPPLIPVESEFTPSQPLRQDSNTSSSWDPGTDVSHLGAVGRVNLSDGDAEQQANQAGRYQHAWHDSDQIPRPRWPEATEESTRLTHREQGIQQDLYSVEAPLTTNETRSASLPTQVRDPAPPQLPQRPADTFESATASGTSTVEPTNTPHQQQKVEHYQIKQIRWHDAYSKRLRTSPILIQNANGPCPLLALVNTLVLSTPMDEETALVETLRTREQVSLGLLLDAVFDELMSGRRGSSANELPDVSELYAFLLTLHTGMNVNPRFVFTSSRSSADFHPAFREYSQPGSFEETKEMRLYSTFNVPLMHGWLPTRDSAAYAAFDRSAKNYDDALNIQFHEEELEDKLGTAGLTMQEQHLFEDLHAIKEFLATWPTQLSNHGLMVLSQHLSPGQFAILFRNDHFSTMYKEPRSQQLLTLVTDAGYSAHEEIVWESLVDVNGAETEHFSGDFRPVGHNIPSSEPGPAGPRNSSLNQQQAQSMLDVDQGWTTVQNKRTNRSRQQNSGSQQMAVTSSGSGPRPLNFEPQPMDNSLPPPPARHGMSQAEQEDADLALALQLQEEEEERQRAEQAARRREEELSSQFIEQDARSPRPVNRGGPQLGASGHVRADSGETRPTIPPRRNNNLPTLVVPRTPAAIGPTSSGPTPPAATTTVRSNQGDEPPPPTYEQAAKGRPFHPPLDHPASPLAPVPGGESSGTSHRRQQSAYMSNSGSYPIGESSTHAAGGSTGRRDRRQSRSGPAPLIDQIPANPGLGPRRRNTLGAQVGGPDERDKCVVM